METNPGLDEVARAAGISTAHLRRTFHRIFQMSPKSFFDQLRFQRAMQLLSDPTVKIEAISIQCGFSSASTFSRAIKNKFDRSPDSWRTL
jgi:AraC family carnitine catabolism transcriptional activator